MSEEVINPGENQEQESSFDIKSFNEALGEGYSFEDLGSLKESLSYKDKFGELNTQFESVNNAKTDIESKYNGILSHFNGENVIDNLYGSRDVWEKVQLEKKFADKDIEAVSKIHKTDLNTINDIDAIVLADKIKYKANISDDDRKAAILKRMGIEDGETTDLDASQKYALSVATTEARESLKGIKDYKPEEPSFDWLNEAQAQNQTQEDRKKEIQGGWEKKVADSLEAYKGSIAYTKEGDEVKELLSYDADDKFKQAMVTQAIQDFTSQGLDPNDEKNQELLNVYIEREHKIATYDKAIKKALESATIKAEDKAHDEINNDQEKNSAEAPPVDTNKTMSLLDYKRKKYKK